LSPVEAATTAQPESVAFQEVARGVYAFLIPGAWLSPLCQISSMRQRTKFPRGRPEGRAAIWCFSSSAAILVTAFLEKPAQQEIVFHRLHVLLKSGSAGGGLLVHGAIV